MCLQFTWTLLDLAFGVCWTNLQENTVPEEQNGPLDTVGDPTNHTAGESGSRMGLLLCSFTFLQ